MNEYHSKLIDKYIPLQIGKKSVRESYDTCHYRKFFNENELTPLVDQNISNMTEYGLFKCTEFVYSKKYFYTTTAEVISFDFYSI